MKRIFWAAALLVLAPLAAKADDAMIPVFDLHTDVLSRMSNQAFDLVDAPEFVAASVPNMKKGGVTEQVFSLWINPHDHPGMDGAQEIFRQIDLFHQQQELHSGEFELATTMAEADAIKARGKIAVFFVIEGASPINDDLSMLRAFYRDGVRVMTLTWTQNLLWAGSSTDKEDATLGLTDFGGDVVREMNRLGMVVDISHVSDFTFEDAIEISTDPVIASHSGCQALYDHPRNVSDDLLRKLAKNGGVIGIVAFPAYLDPNYEANWDAAEKKAEPLIEQALAKYDGDKSNYHYRNERRLLIEAAIPEDQRTGLDIYLDHIEHAIEVAGPEHVGFGSDFDGIWTYVEGLESPATWQEVGEGLRARGHSEEVIRGVMGDNIRRVFRQVLDK